MRYDQAELIEASGAVDREAREFGLPVEDYPNVGSVSMSSSMADGYDLLAISECRACGQFNTTICVISRTGTLEPMSAGVGPKCKTDRCGDKVSAICYAVYDIVEEDAANVDDRDIKVIEDDVKALNDRLRDLADKYGNDIRIVPAIVQSADGFPTLQIDVLKLIARLGPND